MKKWLMTIALALAAFSPALYAQQPPDFKVNSPAVTTIQEALKNRFAQLRPYLESGVLGVTSEGKLAVRDPASVPLDQRQTLNRLLNEQERDSKALYKEIAKANGHPEWEEDIAKTFRDRMRKRMEKMPAGWWIQDDSGQWRKKE